MAWQQASASRDDASDNGGYDDVHGLFKSTIALFFMRLQCACEMSERHKTPTVSSPTHQTPEAGGSHWTPADLNQHQRHRKTPDIMPRLWTHAIIM